MLHIRQLSKTFGQTVALSPTDLHIQKGEFVAILGPSGCGKSTLLRMLAGITPATSGTIDMAGRDITQLPPEQRNIGMVFQSYALFPHMTVRQNLAFGLKMQKVPVGLHEPKVQAAVAMTNLNDYLDRYPRQLSGGQQQRVALARAIVLEPDVMLLDEPLSNLDAKLRESLRDDLRNLHNRLGMTTIYVTHDQSEAMAMADRIVVMNFGKVMETGTPQTLYRQPRQRFTATFLGQTNCLPITALGETAILPWNEEVPLIRPHQGEAVASVRPEDIELVPADDTGSGCGTISRVTYMGSSRDYLVDFNGESYRASQAGGDGIALEVGQPVHLKCRQAICPLEQEAA